MKERKLMKKTVGRYRALITGATGGIGQAIVLAIAPFSDLLILVGRNEIELNKLAAQVWQAKTVVVAGDIADPSIIEKLKQVTNESGGINLLINNAGINEFTHFEDQSIESIRKMVEVNLLSPMQLTCSLLPSLLGYSDSQVINIGSGFSYIGHPGFVAYCATKFGLRGFTEALGRELGQKGVRLRSFSPRATRTCINTAAVRWMNKELHVKEDEPTVVAKEFRRFLSRRETEFNVGVPERFFSKLNQIFPSLIERALVKRSKIIEQALSFEEREGNYV